MDAFAASTAPRDDAQPPVPPSLASGLDALAPELDGEVVLPGSPGWDEARAAWELQVDQRPAAVVIARSERDVVRTVRLAAELGVRLAPQSTGHGSVTVEDLGGAILLRSSALNAVSVDPEARTATVGAGARWADVAAVAAPLGLAGLSGSSSTVGVAGYCLGGGIGWLGRMHGLGAGSILGARVVLPDGSTVVASASEHADLWWALRGGGGIGVVTELTLRLVALPSLVAGTLWWPADRLRDVLHAWARLLPDLPPHVTTAGKIIRFPDIPDVPEQVRGRDFAMVQAVVVGSMDDADRALAPLRSLSPAMDDVAAVTPDVLGELAMDPPDPTDASSEGTVITALDDAVVDAWVDAVESPACADLVIAEIRHLGGALAPGDPDSAALPGLDGVAVVMAVAMVTPVTSIVATRAAVSAALASVAPWASAHQYGNFLETPAAASTLVGGAAARLAEVRARYDPTGVVIRAHGAVA